MTGADIVVGWIDQQGFIHVQVKIIQLDFSYVN